MVPHLPDVQQSVGVPIVGGPVVHKDPGAAATTVHHDPVIQSRIEDVSGLHGLQDGEVPDGEQAGVCVKHIQLLKFHQLSKSPRVWFQADLFIKKELLRN